MVSAKNYALSPAAATLSSGDQVKTELEDDLEERKRKALQAARISNSGSAATNLMSATMGGGIAGSGY